MRHSEASAEFLELLQAVRTGELAANHLDQLRSLVRIPSDELAVTVIMSHKADVDKYNLE